MTWHLVKLIRLFWWLRDAIVVHGYDREVGGKVGWQRKFERREREREKTHFLATTTFQHRMNRREMEESVCLCVSSHCPPFCYSFQAERSELVITLFSSDSWCDGQEMIACPHHHKKIVEARNVCRRVSCVTSFGLSYGFLLTGKKRENSFRVGISSHSGWRKETDPHEQNLIMMSFFFGETTIQ